MIFDRSIAEKSFLFVKEFLVNQGSVAALARLGVIVIVVLQFVEVVSIPGVGRGLETLSGILECLLFILSIPTCSIGSLLLLLQ